MIHSELLGGNLKSYSLENQKICLEVLRFSQNDILLPIMIKLWKSFLHIDYKQKDIFDHKD